MPSMLARAGRAMNTRAYAAAPVVIRLAMSPSDCASAASRGFAARSPARVRGAAMCSVVVVAEFWCAWELLVAPKFSVALKFFVEPSRVIVLKLSVAPALSCSA